MWFRCVSEVKISKKIYSFLFANFSTVFLILLPKFGGSVSYKVVSYKKKGVAAGKVDSSYPRGHA